MPKLPDDIREWKDVDSGSIKQMAYDPDEKILRIKFPNDKEYKYESVGSTLVKKFLKSKSKGGFFHKYIRKHQNRHPFKKVASMLAKSRSDFIGRILTKQTLLEKWEEQ